MPGVDVPTATGCDDLRMRRMGSALTGLMVVACCALILAAPVSASVPAGRHRGESDQGRGVALAARVRLDRQSHPRLDRADRLRLRVGCG